jgi:enoyl-CoA hydratase
MVPLMKLEKDGDIAVVRLSGGKANAMDEAFLRGLVKLVDELEASGARAAVLTGYEKFFSAGLALPSLLGLQRAQLRSFMTLFDTAMRRVFICPLPVVAAVNGHAIAGGCVLALQCDARLMAEGPVKIGLSEVQLGIGLPSSVLESLRFQVPPSSLVPIALEGTLFTPEEAKRLGLVDEVVPMNGLMAAAIERARNLSRAPAEAIAQIKLGLRRPIMQLVEQRWQQQAEWWLDTWFSPATQERLTSAVARLSGPR